MKLNQIIEWLVRKEEIVARFGNARLVRERQGRFQLIGGSAADRSAAKEWASLFLHEAVLAETK